MSYQYKITVFTPTYNRAYIIKNLYNSLRRQSYRDFEWLVVDDGSSDNTEELFGQLKKEADFPIRYHKQNNGGKHTAINAGLELARGELFFTVDSDDWLTDDALEKIHRWEAELPKDAQFCGFSGRLQNTAGQLSGTVFNGPYYDGTTLDRYGIASGERAMVFYTDVHKQYPYPVFPKERFMTEAVTWNRMARNGYRFRFYNDVIWIYEYQADGLTSTGMSLYQRNPQGYGLWMKEKAVFCGYNKWEMFRFYYSAYCEFREHYGWKDIAEFVAAPKLLIRFFDMLFKLKHRGDDH